MAGDAEFVALFALWDSQVIGQQIVSRNLNLATREVEIQLANGYVLHYSMLQALIDIHEA